MRLAPCCTLVLFLTSVCVLSAVSEGALVRGFAREEEKEDPHESLARERELNETRAMAESRSAVLHWLVDFFESLPPGRVSPSLSHIHDDALALSAEDALSVSRFIAAEDLSRLRAEQRLFLSSPAVPQSMWRALDEVSLSQPFVFFHQRKAGGTSLRESLIAISQALRVPSYVACTPAVHCDTYRFPALRRDSESDSDKLFALYAGHFAWGAQNDLSRETARDMRLRLATVITTTDNTRGSLREKSQQSGSYSPTAAQRSFARGERERESARERFRCASNFRHPVRRIESCLHFRFPDRLAALYEMHTHTQSLSHNAPHTVSDSLSPSHTHSHSHRNGSESGSESGSDRGREGAPRRVCLSRLPLNALSQALRWVDEFGASCLNEPFRVLSGLAEEREIDNLMRNYPLDEESSNTFDLELQNKTEIRRYLRTALPATDHSQRSLSSSSSPSDSQETTSSPVTGARLSPLAHTAFHTTLSHAAQCLPLVLELPESFAAAALAAPPLRSAFRAETKSNWNVQHALCEPLEGEHRELVVRSAALELLLYEAVFNATRSHIARMGSLRLLRECVLPAQALRRERAERSAMREKNATRPLSSLSQHTHHTHHTHSSQPTQTSQALPLLIVTATHTQRLALQALLESALRAPTGSLYEAVGAMALTAPDMAHARTLWRERDRERDPHALSVSLSLTPQYVKAHVKRTLGAHCDADEHVAVFADPGFFRIVLAPRDTERDRESAGEREGEGERETRRERERGIHGSERETERETQSSFAFDALYLSQTNLSRCSAGAAPPSLSHIALTVSDPFLALFTLFSERETREDADPLSLSHAQLAVRVRERLRVWLAEREMLRLRVSQRALSATANAAAQDAPQSAHGAASQAAAAARAARGSSSAAPRRGAVVSDAARRFAAALRAASAFNEPRGGDAERERHALLWAPLGVTAPQFRSLFRDGAVFGRDALRLFSFEALEEETYGALMRALLVDPLRDALYDVPAHNKAFSELVRLAYRASPLLSKREEHSLSAALAQHCAYAASPTLRSALVRERLPAMRAFFAREAALLAELTRVVRESVLAVGLDPLQMHLLYPL